jgi:uncharacterized protein (DUF849 family)
MSARAAVDAGAEAVHLHARAPDGSESLMASHIGAAVSAVRRSCPGVPIGVSSGLWVTSGDVWRRAAQVASWADLNPSQRPDFASVNVSEPGFGQLVTLLTDAGIGAEAGVWSVAGADLLAEGLAKSPATTRTKTRTKTGAGLGEGPGWLRILVEIVDPPADGSVDDFVEEAARVVAAVRGLDLPVPVLLHGEERATWPLVRQAGRLGLATRIGLEDVTTGPDGETVRDNAELVRLALREWHAAAG